MSFPLAPSPLSIHNFFCPLVPRFDLAFQVPRFQVKFSFALPGGICIYFGTPFRRSLSHQTPFPFIKMELSPSMEFCDIIFFDWEGILHSQPILVTGSFAEGHSIQVRDCPFLPGHTEQPPPHTTEQRQRTQPPTLSPDGFLYMGLCSCVHECSGKSCPLPLNFG